MTNWAEQFANAPRPVPLSVLSPGTSEAARTGLSYRRMFEWVTYPDTQPMETVHEIPGDEESPRIEQPAAWWRPEFRGFEMRILVNPKGGEDRIQQRSFQAYLRGDLQEEEYLQVIADRVVEWRFIEVMEDGQKVEIPAPGTGGWERFYDLPAGLLGWVILEIRSAHHPKAQASGPTPGTKSGITDSQIQTPIIPEVMPLDS